MTSFLLRRILLAAPALLGVSLVTFLALELSPGDPAEISARALLNVEAPSRETLAQFRREMGLDAPVLMRYSRWLGRTLSGDLGYSYQTRRSVWTELRGALPATLILASTTLALILLLAIPLGVASAARPGSLLDRGTLAGSLCVVAIPDFFLGVLLMLVFALGLRVLPVTGYGQAEHVVLPALTLALCNAAVSVRVVRSSMLEVLGAGYVTAARAKGVGEVVVVGSHALRNALIPILTYISTQYGYLFGGAVVVETLFRWPGLGRLLVEAVNSRDVMVVQGCVLLVALAYLSINLAMDVLYGLIDPRLRLQGAAGR